MKPFSLGLLFVGKFLLLIQFFLLVVGLFIFLFLLDSVLRDCACLGICSFVYFFHVVHFISILFIIISYDPLCFCGVSCNFSFISDFIWTLYFFFNASD